MGWVKFINRWSFGILNVHIRIAHSCRIAFSSIFPKIRKIAAELFLRLEIVALFFFGVGL